MPSVPHSCNLSGRGAVKDGLRASLTPAWRGRGGGASWVKAQVNAEQHSGTHLIWGLERSVPFWLTDPQL